jgi:hypothetical protein
LGAATVTTGLGHLSIVEGAVYRVEVSPEGTPAVRLWRVLPGAPTASWLTPGGALFISCSGGDVLLSPAGELSMAVDPPAPP